MEYLIRKCERNDLPVLVALCQKHAEYEQLPYQIKGKEALLKKAIFSETQRLFCYVIEINGQIGGYFSYILDFSTWDAQTFLYLDCLYLDPEFRGFSIGKSVFAKLKKIAKQKDCINIQWQTPIFNERAIKFYNRIGGIAKDKLRFSMSAQKHS